MPNLENVSMNFESTLPQASNGQQVMTEPKQRAKSNLAGLRGKEADHTSARLPLLWARCNARCCFGKCFWGTITHRSFLKAILLFDTRIIKASKSEILINSENLTTWKWGNSGQPPHRSQSHVCPLVSVCYNRLFHGHMRLTRGHTSH